MASVGYDVQRSIDACLLSGSDPDGFFDVLDELKSFIRGQHVHNWSELLIERYRIKKGVEYAVAKDAPSLYSTGWTKKYRLWADGPYAFVMTDRNEDPLACSSFIVDAPRSVKIMQIQGMSGKQKNKDLRFVRWEKMFIEMTIGWARQRGAKNVKIQSARANKYYDRGLSPDRGIRRYDMTAEEMGFVPDPSGDFFCKYIGDDKENLWHGYTNPAEKRLVARSRVELVNPDNAADHHDLSEFQGYVNNAISGKDKLSYKEWQELLKKVLYKAE